MSKHRPLFLTLTAFATAMGALCIAALAAWLRCGRGSDCSPELALAVAAVLTACLIGILMLIVLRAKVRRPYLRRVTLAAGVAVSALPFAAFLLRDVQLLPVFAMLVAVAVLLAALAESAADGTESAASGHSTAAALGEYGGAASDGSQLKVRSSSQARRKDLLAFLDELAELNREIARLSARIAKHG